MLATPRNLGMVVGKVETAVGGPRHPMGTAAARVATLTRTMMRRDKVMIYLHRKCVVMSAQSPRMLMHITQRRPLIGAVAPPLKTSTNQAFGWLSGSSVVMSSPEPATQGCW